MKAIRMIGKVNAPGGAGPSNGMWALQQALQQRIDQDRIGWLRIGGTLQVDEIPWIWWADDRPLALQCERDGVPFIVGPNVVFIHSRNPRIDDQESGILDSRMCKAFFCHSQWYADLIRKHQGPMNHAEVYTWPYPINPLPAGPISATNDLLIYSKSGPDRGAIIAALEKAFPSSKVIVYGQFKREELFEAARCSRCCVYLSDDDHGPLAQAEIMLSGCPTVGLVDGAPFLTVGVSGEFCEWSIQSMVDSIKQCLTMDRNTVASHARQQFDERSVLDNIIGILKSILCG